VVWFRVDDSFFGHPKAVKLSNDSLATWARAGQWCAWQLTDGVFARSQLEDFTGDADDPAAVALDLLDRRLWEPADDAEHLRFHDWPDWQQTREQVLAKRQLAADRTKRWRERRGDASRDASPKAGDASHGDASRDASPGGGDASRDGGVTHSVTPPRPDPTRPVGSRVGEGANSSDRNAREDDDRPPDWQRGPGRRPADPRAGRAAPRGPAHWPEKCGDCDDNRMITLPGGLLSRCPRCHPLRAESMPGAERGAEIRAGSHRPGGPSQDVAAQAAMARKQLAAASEPPDPQPHPESPPPAEAANTRPEPDW